jgi:hypothetical protein
MNYWELYLESTGDGGPNHVILGHMLYREGGASGSTVMMQQPIISPPISCNLEPDSLP